VTGFGTGEVRVSDDRRVGRAPLLLPLGSGPRKPRILFLIEDEQWFIAEFRELGAPPGSTLHRASSQHGADNVDLLAAVGPDTRSSAEFCESSAHRCTADASDARRIRGSRRRLQLFVIQNPDAPMPVDFVAVERKVHFLDAVAVPRMRRKPPRHRRRHH